MKSMPEKGHSTNKHNPLHQPGMNPEIPPMTAAAKAMLQVRRNWRRCVCKKGKKESITTNLTEKSVCNSLNTR